MNLTLAVNLKNLAISQYTNYNFNSFAKIGDTAIAFSEDGIFELDNVSNDDSDNIDAFAEFPRSDWGIPNQKRIRGINVGHESSGIVQLTITADEGTSEAYHFEPTLTSNKQGSSELVGRRKQKGRYWDFKISNTSGCDFSIDTVDVTPIILNDKPMGS